MLPYLISLQDDDQKEIKTEKTYPTATYPTAMTNKKSEIKTCKNQKGKLTLDHYKNILAKRPRKEIELEKYRKEKELLCKQRITKEFF